MGRYADDFVIVCAIQSDAEKLMAVLPKRFGKYGLTLHPAKTRLVRFTKPDANSNAEGGEGGSGTFDLLGFIHFWRRGRRGSWVIGQKTAKSRLTRAGSDTTGIAKSSTSTGTLFRSSEGITSTTALPGTGVHSAASMRPCVASGTVGSTAVRNATPWCGSPSSNCYDSTCCRGRRSSIPT